ncbi:hypothetical protein TSUD_211430 [Trifolium subterraneum]|uniref:RING-type E3 ubiquitin transferase n=1 Tax=Trifolium subterraneum TaxID=3900 RepID=A0A2Z6NJ94_TRISU|nr:hypothetical protein TSUD_211430 [Trifolium subterraneum]
MGTDSSEVVETLPDPRSFKVHRRMCTELKKLVDRVLKISPQIEEARPRSSSGIPALVLLTSTLDKAKQLLHYCSDSSKLYLAMTGESILSRCQKARKSLEKSLVQIQDIVPVMLAAEISRIIDDLRCVTFVLDSAEEEAGRVMRELLQQGPSTLDNDSKENSDVKSLQFAAARLNITSATSVVIEKRSIVKLLQKVGPEEENKKAILKNLLYLVRKYGNLLNTGEQAKDYSHHEEPAATENSGRDSLRTDHVKLGPYLNHGQYGTRVSELSRVPPPQEYTCPISFRLMYDPVVIASGETYERMWIQKYFDEGHVICPKTKKKLPHMAMTPNVALKKVISNWCKTNGVSIPNPSRQAEDIRLWEDSIASIRSFGSSMNGLNLPMDLSNISLGSLDNSYNSDSSLVKASHGLNSMLINTRNGSHGHQSHSQIHDTYLVPLSKLHDRQWDSQCQVVEDMKRGFKCNNQAFGSVSSENFIDPLVRFLSTAYDKHDTKALRSGSQLLLEFTKYCRNCVTNLSEDTCSVLASLLESDVIGEALAILETLSNQWSNKADVAASSALTSISKILDSGHREYQHKAIRIMCNFSSNSELCSFMVSLDCIPKILPFFEDKSLWRDCICILKNLCDTKDGRISIVETDGCMSRVVEVLGSDTDEEKEPALAIVLSLCSQRLEYCELVMYEGIIPYLVNISNKGNDNTKVKAVELLRLLREVEPNLNNSRDSNEDHFEDKKPSKKSNSIFKKLSRFGRSSSDS